MSYPSVVLNVNQQCTITLTDKGVDSIYKHYGDLRMSPPRDFSEGDEYTTELWNIMNIFGTDCVIGLSPPFETEIKVHALS